MLPWGRGPKRVRPVAVGASLARKELEEGEKAANSKRQVAASAAATAAAAAAAVSAAVAAAAAEELLAGAPQPPLQPQPPFPGAAVKQLDAWADDCLSAAGGGAVDHHLAAFAQEWRALRRRHAARLAAAENEHAVAAAAEHIVQAALKGGWLWWPHAPPRMLVPGSPDRYCADMLTADAAVVDLMALECEVGRRMEAYGRQAEVDVRLLQLADGQMLAFTAAGLDVMSLSSAAAAAAAPATIPRVILPVSFQLPVDVDVAVTCLLLPEWQHEVLGGLFLPACMRRVRDTRPVCCVVAGAEDPAHPMRWVLRALCGLAVVRSVPPTTLGPRLPYIFLVDLCGEGAACPPDPTAQLEAAQVALAVGAAVVILLPFFGGVSGGGGGGAAAQHYLAPYETLRLSAAYFPPVSGGVHAVWEAAAVRSLLCKSHQAYCASLPAEGTRHHSYAAVGPRLRHRLPGPVSMGTLLVEMMQVGVLRCAVGNTATLAEVREVLVRYCADRLPTGGSDVLLPGSADVLVAASKFRQLVAAVAAVEPVTWHASQARFHNLGTAASSGLVR